MNLMKLFSSTAVIFLSAVLSSGAAIASCGDGILLNETFDGNLRVNSDDYNCSIIGSTIGGNLIVTNVNNLLLLNNKVGGEIQVDGNANTGTANVIANTVMTGDLTVKDMEVANVIENETLSGSIRVNGNISAVAQKNISADKIKCKENTTLKSFFNFAINGVSCE